MKKCTVTLFLCLCWLGNLLAQSGGLPCANSQPFCTGSTTFPAIVNGGSAPVGPNYGCLGGTPNPSWFYLQVGQAGVISMNISGASPLDDIDFAAWGPFTSLASGCGQLTAACNGCPSNVGSPGFYPSGNMVDCSFSGSNTENCTIPNAQVGQIYIVLITNFAGSNTNITFAQTNTNQPGAGATDCNILSGTPSPCNQNTNLYTLSGTYMFSTFTPGSSTSLTITNSCSGTVLTYTPPFSSPIAFSFPNLSANGAPCTLTATFSNGTVKTFTYNAPPPCATNTVAASSPTVCPGQSAVLTPTTDLAGPTYTWNPGGIVSPTITVSPTATTVYTLLASGTNTIINAPSTASITVPVGVYIVPTPTIITNSVICQGAVLTASVWPGMASQYNWTGPNGFSSSLTTYTMSLPNAQPAMSGTYSITSVYPNGCRSSSSASITVVPTPSVVAGNNSPICQGTTLNMMGNDFGGGAISWSWSGPGGATYTGQSVLLGNAQPSASGVFTLTATYSGGCMASDTTLVNVIPLPIPFVGSNSPVCLNNPLNLTASGGTTYQWTGPNGFTAGIDNPGLSNVVAADAGVYTVTITTSNCSSVGATTVTVYPALHLAVSQSVTICAKDLTTLVASGSGGNGNLNYSWQPNSGLYGIPGASVSASPGSSTDYTVTLADNCNTPTQSAVITVSVNPKPVIAFGADQVLGCAPVCATFTMSSFPAAAACTWTLEPMISGTLTAPFPYCFADSGRFDVGLRVTDIHGCISDTLLQDYIRVYANPVANFDWNPEAPSILDNLVQFNNQSMAGTGNINTWAWSFGDPDSTLSSQKNPSMTYLDIGDYPVWLIVRDDLGCTDSILQHVLVQDDYVIYIPNAFTPNGDHLNDRFWANGTGFGSQDLEMFVYDRWGREMYHGHDAAEGWDGRVLGADAPAGVYTYKIYVTAMNRQSLAYTGHVSLIR